MAKKSPPHIGWELSANEAGFGTQQWYLLRTAWGQRGEEMHRYGALAIDLIGVAMTPFLALLIRDNFVFYAPHWQAIVGYATISFVILTAAIVIAGSHKVLWQYTSLPDILRVISLLTIALVLGVVISFMESRLEGVARSVPVIQWFLLVSAIVGNRIVFRLWHERARRHLRAETGASLEHVLVVGVGALTELYLESATQFGSRSIAIVGILSDREELGGLRMRQHKILGRVEELPRVIDRLEVHGISVGRVVVTESFAQLSQSAGQILLELERSSSVKVDWIVESLGFGQGRVADNESDAPYQSGGTPEVPLSNMSETGIAPLGRYGYVKRAFDLSTAFILCVVLAPLMLIVALLVYFDVGAPIVFWQQRPGRFGLPFKLYKFCSMRPAHDTRGHRIPDEQRVSAVGDILRKTRLDELPQIYNILIGEMSFVGPRPLLAADQPKDMTLRLFVRPGLTGLAQVHGGRDISPEDKNACDQWYIRNASLWLDIDILVRTVGVVIRGERINDAILRTAHEELGSMKDEASARAISYSRESRRAWDDKNSGVFRPAA